MLQIGDIRIHLLNDGTVHVDGGGPFGLVPRTLWSRYLPPDDENLVPMILNSLLVQVGGRNLLVDAGIGDKLSEKQRRDIWHLSRTNGTLLDGLARLELQPTDIDMVIDTHLHADHSGWNTMFGPDGEILPTFPNAEYVVQRREYDDATHPNERTRATYLAENFQPLIDSGQMRLLDGDTDIASGIRGVITRGHTPGHMSIRFESQGQHAAFVCDMASYAIHFERLGWMTAYDVEPLETLETKRRWQQWALDTNAVLIFPHDTVRPVGRLTLDEHEKPRVVPIEEAYV
jgi:glyoxylase-like metal-dependent hydrolase (beta-lactamase superfamily II)